MGTAVMTGQYAVIRLGRVVNIVEASDDYAASQGWVPALESKIGDIWEGDGKFTRPLLLSDPTSTEEPQS